MGGLTLDTGALIAAERGDERMRALLELAHARRLEIDVPAGVVAQAWRGGPRQARLASLLDAPEVTIVSLDGETARAVGRMCGASGHADVVDVHVALHAVQRGHRVVTSDPQDLRKVAPSVSLIEI